MQISRIGLLFVFLLQAYSFIIPMSNQLKSRIGYRTSVQTAYCQDESMPYLDRLENQNKDKVEKLKSIRNNITKYIVANENNKKPTNSTTKARSSSAYSNPIIPIDFDNLFLNINNISKIYLSSDYDRAIFYMINNRRHIYTIKSKTDRELIEKIIRFISQPVKIIVICDKTLFTDKFGFLYYDT